MSDHRLRELQRKAALGDDVGGYVRELERVGRKNQARLLADPEWDWEHVFAYANGGKHGEGGWPRWAGSGPNDPPARPATRFDVAEVLAMVEGENDGPYWLGVFRLNDGRFLYIEAGCDYTGWG